MILRLFRPKTRDHTDALYAEIVALARQPVFYRDFSVPDTVEGRFEMILMHLSLLFHRLAGESGEARGAAQKVLDAFFSDMDRSLREMGIGDLSVPKKMKKLGEAYTGRALAYERALMAGDAEALAAAIRRNVMAIDAGSESPAQLAASAAIAGYMLASAGVLADQPADTILQGTLRVAPPPFTTGAS